MEVKLGEEYEVVLTNPAGLYRYRLGDVVKIKGFYNSTPQLQFVCRRSLLLTVNIDKNTEKDLQLAVEEATELLTKGACELVDFTSYVDMSSDLGHYVIFWELKQEASESTLKIVKNGTFHRILDHYLNQGAAVSQFKMPRCIGASNQAVHKILKNNVSKSYFSTAY